MSPMLLTGTPAPLGARFTGDGVNFAVFSAYATRIDLCLFDAAGRERRLPLPMRTGDIWHGFAPGLAPGQRYGYRAHGPWAPHEGHLFNAAKLLLDPYARALEGRVRWHPAMSGSRDGGPCGADSAPHVPKCLVRADAPAVAAPEFPPALIYEAHVKGLTARHPGVAADRRGTYDGLADPAVIGHLRALGVSHVELLPVTAFLDDRHVVERGLTNYWGYQPIAPFAPEPRYAGPTGQGGLGAAILRLAEAGIGVILDVVFNHTGEGDAEGPTLGFRGLDNRSYYALTPEGCNLNHTGTGNMLDMGHPAVLRLTLDALRHWAAMGVAGFRFDLAATLTRAGGGLVPGSGFLDAVRADPVLGRLILIAEPWDIGPDGYRLGRFPAPFREWNDRFRDDARRFWRGDGRPAELARRIAGSAEIFDRTGRGAGSSVNYVTAHDGFTLQDVVSYRQKHNLANGEGGHDGHHDNCSDNLGAEGPTGEPAIRAARARRVRALLATLFLAQGTPMLLAGDELGQSQGGNNNAYAQDNALTWLDWARADPALAAFVARLSTLRRAHPALRQDRFLHGARRADGLRDLVWRRADGREAGPEDWHRPDPWILCCEKRMAAGTPDPTAGAALYLVFNPGAEDDILLPEGRWTWLIDSAAPERAAARVKGRVRIGAQSVHLFSQPGGNGQGE